MNTKQEREDLSYICNKKGLTADQMKCVLDDYNRGINYNTCLSEIEHFAWGNAIDKNQTRMDL